MKKLVLGFMLLVIILSFCGCGMTESMFGTNSGAAYFNKPENAPEITFTYYSEAQGDKIEEKLEDAAFCDKLGEIIDGKPVGEDFCKCDGDYQVTINGEYLFYLHPNKIVVFTDLEDYSGFTVDCSETESKILYDIIESKK